MKVLTPTEKKRYQQASNTFFDGCKVFVEKCVDERRKIFKDVEKIIEIKKVKIEQENKNTENENNTKTMLFVVGGIAGSLGIILYKLGKVDKDIKDKYVNTSKDYENVQTELSKNDPKVKETEEVYKKSADTLGEKIEQALAGFFSMGDSRFVVDELRNNGFAEPILTVVFKTGLYWSMMASGLEWLADLFNIRNPLTAQLQYGIFAELYNDKNAYFGNVSGAKGFEGVQHTVQGYNYIRLATTQQDILKKFVVQPILGQVAESAIDDKQWTKYIEALNVVEASIRAGVNSNQYTMNSINAHRNANVYDIIRHLGAYTDRGTTDFQYPLHSIIWNGRGISLNYGDTGKFPHFGSGHELHFVDDMVEYVERYTSSMSKSGSQMEQSLISSWNSTKSGWRGDYDYYGNYFFFYRDGEREVRWIAINLFCFLSFVPLVAEHEIHTSKNSIQHISNLYEEFLIESGAVKTMNEMADFIREQQQFRDKYVDLYMSGLITLNEYLNKVKDEIKMIMNYYDDFHYRANDSNILLSTSLINTLNFDKIAKEINFMRDYINPLKRIVKKIQLIRSMIGFDMSAEMIDDEMNKLDDEDSVWYNSDMYSEYDLDNEMKSKIILIDNWSTEPDFAEGKQSNGGTLDTLKDYMGDNIGSSSVNSTESILDVIFNVSSVLDERICQERRKRNDLLNYIKLALKSYYEEEQQEE